MEASPHARYTLSLGNLAIGMTVVAPTGMFDVLAGDLGVSITDIGLLFTLGAVVLCFGSPLVAWLTSGIDRRKLLAGTLFLVALGNLAAALAPNYATLLAVRLVTVAVVAVYTPQAGGTMALIAAPENRASAIAFVFVGWSLAVAAGLPAVAFFAPMIGWRAIHLALTLLALVSAAALLPTLPRGVRGAPLSLASWAEVARHRQIVLLLATTALLTTGQFAVFTFVAPIAQRLADAGPAVIGMLFATAGVMGLVGNLLASQVVGRLGVVRTSALAFGVMAVGWLLWALGAGVVPAMVVSLALNGIGFAGVSGLQQARLVTAAPALATGTVALNSATIYVGQAAGSGIGGLMIAHDYYRPLGWIAVAFTLAAIAAFWPTRRGDGPPVPVA
jgi:predicted MFS family arabinose efflux permease